jgi:hypothetical protein
MLADQILHQLKLNGQMLDTEIATATGVSIKQIRSAMADMATRGVVMGCSVTRYVEGKPLQALQYRISGYLPPSAPGRKPSHAAR